MGLLGKFRGRKVDPVAELIGSLEPDILSGTDSDRYGRSFKVAEELSKIGEPAVGPLIQALSRSSYAHRALGLIGGERAFQALSGELRTGSAQRVKAAAAALGQIGDPRALELLKPHLGSSDYITSNIVFDAIAKIKRAQMGEDRWLQVDRDDPYGQVRMVFGQLDSISRDTPLRERAIKWHREFVAAMPKMKFSSEKERGHAWELLGTLIFYFLNPGLTSFTVKCPEAAYCYEQCLKFSPDKKYIRESLPRIK